MSNYPESIAETDKLREAYTDLRRYTLLAYGTSQTNQVNQNSFSHDPFHDMPAPAAARQAAPNHRGEGD